MPVYLFYVSNKQTGPDSQPIQLPDGNSAFIRVQLATANLPLPAMREANTRPGEHFLNSSKMS